MDEIAMVTLSQYKEPVIKYLQPEVIKDKPFFKIFFNTPHKLYEKISYPFKCY